MWDYSKAFFFKEKKYDLFIVIRCAAASPVQVHQPVMFEKLPNVIERYKWAENTQSCEDVLDGRLCRPLVGRLF